MNPDISKLQNASMDDIVFMGRNKEYGAYMLRQIYGKHVRNGYLIAMSLFLLFLGGPILLKKLMKEEVKKVEEPTLVDLANIKPPPPVDPKTPPPPPPPPPPPIKSTVKFTPPVIKKDDEVPPEDPPKQNELTKVDVSDKTEKGDPDAGVSNLVIDAGNGNQDVEVKQEPRKFVEQMPTYPGGESAMLEFLQRNMDYPEAARTQEIEGRVILNFVVDENGTITDVKCVKDIGGGCGEAAIKAVRKMPRWTPGRQNGKAVPVYFNLPVMFTLSTN